MKKFFSDMWDYILNMPGELIVALFVMLIIAIISIILGYKIKKADPCKVPKGGAFVADYLVDFSQKTINEYLGKKYLKFTPYFIFIILFIPFSFIASLFGLPSPFTYLTIPLALAIVTWFGIQITSIVYNKWDYLKSFTSPLPPWLPILAPVNLIGKLSPLISLSVRMFGNAVAGFVVMTLVYWGTGILSDAILGLFNATSWMNFAAPIIAPFLHLYFDLFSAFIQTLIFVMLTLLLISNEIPEVNSKIKEKKEV